MVSDVVFLFPENGTSPVDTCRIKNYISIEAHFTMNYPNSGRRNFHGRRIQGVVRYGNAYRAQINRLSIIFFLGSFNTEREASEAYDRAVLLTRAWVQRGVHLNDPKAELPEGYVPNGQEAAMISRLRSMDHAAESSWKDREKLQECTPEDIVKSYERLMVEHHGFTSRFEQLIDGVKIYAERIATERLQARELIEQRDYAIEDLQAELAALKGEAPAVKGPIVFKPVAPAPIVKNVLVAEPVISVGKVGDVVPTAVAEVSPGTVAALFEQEKAGIVKAMTDEIRTVMGPAGASNVKPVGIVKNPAPVEPQLPPDPVVFLNVDGEDVLVDDPMFSGGQAPVQKPVARTGQVMRGAPRPLPPAPKFNHPAPAARAGSLPSGFKMVMPK